MLLFSVTHFSSGLPNEGCQPLPPPRPPSPLQFRLLTCREIETCLRSHGREGSRPQPLLQGPQTIAPRFESLSSDTQPPSLPPENRHPSNVQLPHGHAEKTVAPSHATQRGASCVLDPCSVSPSLHTCPVRPAVGSRDTELGPHGGTDPDSVTIPYPPQGPCLNPPLTHAQGCKPLLLPSPPHLSGPNVAETAPRDGVAV